MLLPVMIGCTQKKKDLYGAGASFPEPLYNKMLAEYELISGENIVYEGIGSGAGIFRLKEKTVDFAGTDKFLETNDLEEEILHIPTSLGAVVASYNLPANPVLNFSPSVLAAIFLGEIKNWNDERIKEINPDVILPNQRILLINRSDDSGTCQIFNDYLSKVSTKWQEQTRNPFKEFFSLTAANNRELADLIINTPYSIGVICLSYAVQKNLAYARILNSSGNYILPSPVSVSAAAETEIPDDTKIYITNTDAEMGYPISSFTWIIVHRDLSYLEQNKAEKIIVMLNWMVSDGQKFAPALQYAPLPHETKQKAKTIIKSIEYKTR